MIPTNANAQREITFSLFRIPIYFIYFCFVLLLFFLFTFFLTRLSHSPRVIHAQRVQTISIYTHMNVYYFICFLGYIFVSFLFLCSSLLSSIMFSLRFWIFCSVVYVFKFLFILFFFLSGVSFLLFGHFIKNKV